MLSELFCRRAASFRGVMGHFVVVAAFDVGRPESCVAISFMCDNSTVGRRFT